MRFQAKSRFRNTIWQSTDRFLTERGKDTRMKTIVVTRLLVVFGLLLVPVGVHGQAPVPLPKRPAKAQNAGTQTAVQDTELEVVQLSPKNLPQDPIGDSENKGMKDGMQGAKPPTKLVLQTVDRNALQKGTPNAAQNAVPNAPPNTAANTAMPEATTSNAAETSSPNTNASVNTKPNVNRAANQSEPAAAPTGPIPPAINAGIEAMVSSKASLENAGNKWGGHKQKAIQFIDQALAACGQTSTPDSGAAKSGAADDTAMQTALTQLTAAQQHLMSAKNAWGGRRDKALALVNQALSEVQAGIDFAKK